jgi:hypothetical protein
MKNGIFAYIGSANSAVISIFLVYLVTLASMPGEVTAQGQSGFIPTPPSNNNTSQIPFDDRCDPNQALIPLDCPTGDQNTQQEGTIPGSQQQPQQQQQQEEEVEWLLYENATHGVSMLYPSTWIQQGGTLGAADARFIYVSDFFSPGEADEPFAFVSIAIDNMPPSTNLEDSLSDTINNYMQDLRDFRVLSSNTDDFTLAGMAAYALEAAYSDPEFGPQNMLIVETIVDNKGYSISYIAEPQIYQKYLPIIEEMISSMQLSSVTGVPAAAAPTTEDDFSNESFVLDEGRNMTFGPLGGDQTTGSEGGGGT